MADNSNAKRIAAVAAMGMNALKPILNFQISMLRMWADSIERFAGSYEKELDETNTAIKKKSDKEQRAA